MDLLPFILTLCYRKAIVVIALYGIMICLLTTKCQSLSSGRTVHDMRNPRIATDKCGRQGVVSSVCDPDGVITFGEASQLDDLILHVHNNTNCPCSMQVCKQAPGGYRIAVAIIQRMWLDPDLRYRASSPVEDTRIQAMDALLSEAKQFAHGLLQSWNMGRCQEDIIILYAHDNNIIYTATNAKARELLNDRIVSEIAMKWRIYFGPNKHSNALGLLHIIDDYRAVLRNTYIKDLSRQHPRVRKTEPLSLASDISLASVSLLCSLEYIEMVTGVTTDELMAVSQDSDNSDRTAKI